MRILVLVGSEKRCGNTEKIVDSFYSGIDRTKHEVQILNVSTMKINPCRDCNQCKHLKEKFCIQKDDMNIIYDAVMQSECVVLAYPVYFSFMPGKLKMVIDRFHAFGKRFNYEYPQKKLIMLMSSSDDSSSTKLLRNYSEEIFVRHLKWELVSFYCIGNCDYEEDFTMKKEELNEVFMMSKKLEERNE